MLLVMRCFFNSSQLFATVERRDVDSRNDTDHIRTACCLPDFLNSFFVFRVSLIVFRSYNVCAAF